MRDAWKQLPASGVLGWFACILEALQWCHLLSVTTAWWSIVGIFNLCRPSLLSCNKANWGMGRQSELRFGTGTDSVKTAWDSLHSYGEPGEVQNDTECASLSEPFWLPYQIAIRTGTTHDLSELIWAYSNRSWIRLRIPKRWIDCRIWSVVNPALGNQINWLIIILEVTGIEIACLGQNQILWV